jgi:hypothetical protein
MSISGRAGGEREGGTYAITYIRRGLIIGDGGDITLSYSASGRGGAGKNTQQDRYTPARSLYPDYLNIIKRLGT